MAGRRKKAAFWVILSLVGLWFFGFGFGFCRMSQAYAADANYVVVDDMESYNDSNNHIWDTWLAGINEEHIELAIEPCQPVHSGGQSMEYWYDNCHCSERCPHYSQAIREYDPPLDWSSNGEKALTLWFRGSPDYGIAPMWVMLNNVAPLVTYGDNGEDPEDITKEQWTEWNIRLQDFADGGIDLANVSSITIGLGYWPNCPGPEYDGSAGVVYFDDIRLYPGRCFGNPQAGDLSRDCLVDERDLGIMGDHWLSMAADSNSTTIYDANDYNDCQAKQPVPPDGQININFTMSQVVLCWEEGSSLGGRGRHGLYLSDDFNDVNDAVGVGPPFVAHILANLSGDVACYDTTPLGLELWKTYYWRVDEYGEEPCPYTTGKTWTFTTGCELLVSDINSDCVVNLKDYAQLTAAWLDEVPFWPAE